MASRRHRAFSESWDRKPGRPDHAALIRQRVASALLEAGITAADTKVFIGQECAVILQFAPPGGPQVRRRTAARVIAALSVKLLGLTDEASHSAEDMEDISLKAAPPKCLRPPVRLSGGPTEQSWRLST